MNTLYDLLGALPRDDAEGLRTAFRRAVKGTHPDIKPGDPDAALKFRQIIRAQEILGDSEQRAAYDHLLTLAQHEKEQAAKLPVVATVHKLASGVMTLAAASIVAIISYLLSTALVATANKADPAPHSSPHIAAVIPAEIPPPDEVDNSSARPAIAVTFDAIAASAAGAPAGFESMASLDLAASADPVPNYARFFQARGIAAYRNGDFNGAIADLDQAIQLDPKLSVSYIDRGIVFYRLRKFDRVFANVARTKRTEKQSHAKPAQAASVKRHSEAVVARVATPPPPRRPIAPVSQGPEWYPPRQESMASIGFN
jgi:curved DNA-binding protein CbpA